VPELIVYGIVLGSITALGAIGLTLVYGILRFANFAHGDLMTAGAFIAFFLVTGLFPWLGIPDTTFGPLSFGWRMALAFPISMACVAVVSILLDRILYRPLRLKRSPSVILAMSALGASFIIRILLVVLALVILLYLFLQRTKMGKAMRATADNMELARVSGIDTERVIIWTWGIGGALAAAGGMLYGIDVQLHPGMGWHFLLPLFAATILGGIGNMYGALVGALVMGVAQQVSTAYLLPTYKPAVAFMVMILILLVRPQGIFGGRRA
jgi:branched-chain amino acid transport system permease protein/neutral amino acid transport system permease protein